ncbi:Uncharacterized membrane protein YgdD, TMEM256/DUF423 family [Singulisphaera sp. GP187]|uniref:DUF423 domain-containing protein n=1 Tax=Singulisphaera sp. GP187 TaxID=1882752 RepID=UPI000925A5B8|nr:DUF423 domain-containing protein [Singulisphaera sp. GP187]SIN82916.1 Uncharacterized membrane protein YgdD, TMEM256/DUF423 family [Singulisphaera sp. GP187]
MSGWAWLRIGAISGFLSVALGAFGAHSLRDRFKVEESDSFEARTSKHRMIENFETAARYQMYHALAIGAVALLAIHGRTGGAVSVAGWAFLVGTLLFSGSLYILVLSGQRWLGAITPLGGLSFLVGWLALAVAASGPSRP